MKYIITETQYKRMFLTEHHSRTIEYEQGIDEGRFGNFLRSVPQRIKNIPLFSRKDVPTLHKEISRVIPKGYLTDKNEVTNLINKLHTLGKDVDLIKPNYIKKYGQESYDSLLRQFLYNGVDKKTFVNTLKNVKNPTLQLKPILGQGRDHRIYMSKTQPDKIFKMEMSPGEVDKWYGIFTSHPDIFPKVYKKIKVKTKESGPLTAVVLEKLNTPKFTKLWSTMETSMRDCLKNVPVSEKALSLEGLAKGISSPKLKKQWNDVLMYIKKQEPSLVKDVDEFSTIVDKLYKLTPNPDIRQFNFGYDTKGTLKSLDI